MIRPGDPIQLEERLQVWLENLRCDIMLNHSDDDLLTKRIKVKYTGVIPFEVLKDELAQHGWVLLTSCYMIADRSCTHKNKHSHHSGWICTHCDHIGKCDHEEVYYGNHGRDVECKKCGVDL